MFRVSQHYGFNARRSARVLTLIDRTAGTNIGNMTVNGGLAAAFDGTTSQARLSCATISVSNSGYVGKTLAANKIFGQAIIYGSNDQGFIRTDDVSTTINIRGKTGAAPSSATDGTIIGTLSFTDTSNESAGRTITSTDTTSLWAHIFAEVINNAASGRDIHVAELVLYEMA